MRKLYTLTLMLLFACAWTFAQVPTSWTDNFDDNTLDEAWNENPGIYTHVEENGELTITIAKAAMWDGFHLKFPDKINLADHPYASFKLKADTALDFRIYLWDENDTDTLYNQANADTWVVPGDTYNTYYFNWKGKFKHQTEVDGEQVIMDLDSTDIEGFLINVDPGYEDLYQGVLKLEDVMVGQGAEQATEAAELSSSAIGSVGATVVSDIPEGTLVSDFLAGITHNGDAIVLHAAGPDGEAGVEAEGSDEMDSSMDLVVYLEGSAPRKYDILVAPPALACYYRADFPTVDAEIDEVWGTVPVHDMPHLLNGTIDGPTDFSATFRTLWDEVSLFFLVEVVDDVKFTDTGFPTPYSDDCVEFWFDLNNSKNSSYLPSETDEYQIIFLRDNTNQHQVDHNDLLEGIDWAWLDTQNGYIFEIEMPWLTAFKWLERFDADMPEFGQKLGFEVHVNDDDDGEDRDCNIGWFYTIDEAWRDPSTLGDMQMKEEIMESSRDLKESFTLRVKPNPAADYLQILSSSMLHSVEVVNMAGQVVLEYQAGSEAQVHLDISGIPQNLYLLRVKDVHGKLSTGTFIKQ